MARPNNLSCRLFDQMTVMEVLWLAAGWSSLYYFPIAFKIRSAFLSSSLSLTETGFAGFRMRLLRAITECCPL